MYDLVENSGACLPACLLALFSRLLKNARRSSLVLENGQGNAYIPRHVVIPPHPFLSSSAGYC